MKSQIRVLAVSTVPETLYRFVAPLARAVKDNGVEFSAATGPMNGDSWDLSAFQDVHTIRWSRKPTDVSNVTAAVKDLRSAATADNYDLIHVHTPIASFVTRTAIRHSLPIVYTAHGFHFYEGGSPATNFAYMALEKFAARWTRHLVVINEEDHRAALALGLADEQRLTLMGGVGVEFDEFPRRTNETHEFAKSSLCGEIGIAEDTHLALMIARIDPNKRQTDAIKALAQQPAESRSHLVLAGTGTAWDEQECVKVASDLGVVDHVHFLGYRTDVEHLLRASDVFLLISDREGLPRSIMEALSVGTPVIGTNIRGTRDLLQRGAGILVEPRAPSEISRALTQSRDFVPDDERVQQVLDKCSLQQVRQEHLEVYSHVVARESERMTR